MDTNGQATYEVQSFSSDWLYIVRLNAAGEYSCSCPHWQYRLAAIRGHCKHIQQLLAGGAANSYGQYPRRRRCRSWRSSLKASGPPEPHVLTHRHQHWGQVAGLPLRTRQHRSTPP